jgi:hypothetical protein
MSGSPLAGSRSVLSEFSAGRQRDAERGLLLGVEQAPVFPDSAKGAAYIGEGAHAVRLAVAQFAFVA